MERHPGKWLEISPWDYKGFYLFIYWSMQYVKFPRHAESGKKLDFLLTPLPYISFLWIGHADTNGSLQISEGSHCSWVLSEGCWWFYFHQGTATTQAKRLIYFPHENRFSQRTPREAALWNFLILFIPEVLGFLPNAHPSLFQYVIMVLTYVCLYHLFKSIYV